MTSTSLRIVLGLASVLAAGGCSDRFIVQDGVISSQLDLESALSLEPIDLHAPYLLGADYRFSVLDRLHVIDFEGWTIESADPSIAEVLEVKRSEVPRSAGRLEITEAALEASIHAVGVGDTTILVRDRQGDIRAEAPFEAAPPSRVQLLAAAPLVVPPETQEEVTRPRIVAGGTGTFLVRYFDGDRLLHGTLDLAASPPPGAGGIDVEGTPQVEASIFPFNQFLDYQWVQVQTAADGTFPIELIHDGAVIHRFDVDAVSSSAIVSLDLHAVDEDEVALGERRRVALRAFDGAHQPIYGVAPSWWVDGRSVAEEARGDILSYTRASTRSIGLTARFQGIEATTTIHGEDLSVSSSNDVEIGSCSIGERRGPPWLWLVLAVVVARRRRRSAGRAAGAPPSPPERALPSP